MKLKEYISEKKKKMKDAKNRTFKRNNRIYTKAKLLEKLLFFYFYEMWKKDLKVLISQMSMSKFSVLSELL